MNLNSFFSIILVAVSYYLFSNEFFQFSAAIEERKATWNNRFFAFLIIYIWFVIASFLELPLIMNWFVFLIILGLEVRLVFTYDFLISYALSLFCVITGLAVNVFFRSLASIILDVPLNIFDKSLSSLKTYPIFVGFLVMALLLFILRRIRFTLHLKKMLHYRKSLIFYTWTEVFIYLFLIIQLLAFSQTGDTMGIKVWGIKSACFSIVTLIITIIYSLRVASLNYFMEKQHEIRSHLIQEKNDINKLWKLAFTDMLTGCNNRLLLDKRLEEYANYGGSLTLAFIDVNGLKTVNDQYGHIEGDRYLITITQILTEISKTVNFDLFRYGGDEFVMISNSSQEQNVSTLLTQTNERLKNDKTVPYPRSISYGVVHGESSEYQQLITAADEIMYRHKMKHYKDRVRP